jgi:hypothetical protein
MSEFMCKLNSREATHWAVSESGPFSLMSPIRVILFLTKACTLQNAWTVLQTHIYFPRFLPIFPDFLERLSHLAPIY